MPTSQVLENEHFKVEWSHAFHRLYSLKSKGKVKIVLYQNHCWKCFNTTCEVEPVPRLIRVSKPASISIQEGERCRLFVECSGTNRPTRRGSAYLKYRTAYARSTFTAMRYNTRPSPLEEEWISSSHLTLTWELTLTEGNGKRNH